MGESTEWAMEVDGGLLLTLRAAQTQAKVKDVEVRAVMALGTGKEVQTRERITFTAEELEPGDSGVDPSGARKR